jgi:ATP-dependent DNA helicase 2 subunit 2
MGEACVIVPRKFSEKDELALSALINTLYEVESYAVARFVSKDMKEPQLLLLKPSIEVDFECLYDVPLPFAEDVRAYQFPPLDKVITITGSVLTKHRLLPSDDLNKAMSDYVDAMDISQFGTDDDG